MMGYGQQQQQMPFGPQTSGMAQMIIEKDDILNRGHVLQRLALRARSSTDTWAKALIAIGVLVLVILISIGFGLDSVETFPMAIFNDLQSVMGNTMVAENLLRQRLDAVRYVRATVESETPAGVPPEGFKIEKDELKARVASNAELIGVFQALESMLEGRLNDAMAVTSATKVVIEGKLDGVNIHTAIDEVRAFANDPEHVRRYKNAMGSETTLMGCRNEAQLLAILRDALNVRNPDERVRDVFGAVVSPSDAKSMLVVYSSYDALEVKARKSASESVKALPLPVLRVASVGGFETETCRASYAPSIGTFDMRPEDNVWDRLKTQADDYTKRISSSPDNNPVGSRRSWIIGISTTLGSIFIIFGIYIMQWRLGFVVPNQ